MRTKALNQVNHNAPNRKPYRVSVNDGVDSIIQLCNLHNDRWLDMIHKSQRCNESSFFFSFAMISVLKINLQANIIRLGSWQEEP